MKNRIIKFRAWVNGSGIPRMIDWEDITAIEWCNDKLWHHDGEYTLLGNLKLLQFVGLRDKNRKDLVEGDVIKSDGGITCVVEWVDTSKGNTIGFFLTNSHGFIAPLTPSTGKIIEVIGNIYSNPEFLK